MKNKKNMMAGILLIIGLVMISVGTTYGSYTFVDNTDNQQLVLGDIYIYFNNISNTITDGDLLPTTMYELNTSEEKVNLCVSYLRATYGDSWNGLVASNEQAGEMKNDNTNYNAQFMASLIVPTYAEYCSDKVPVAFEEDTTFDIVANAQSGVLSDADIKYFVNNGIFTDKIAKMEYFEFKVSGKNTNSKGDIAYDITLSHGEDSTTKTERIKDGFLRFRLTDGEGNILRDNLTFDEINNSVLYSNSISKNNSELVTHNYRLYMWVTDTLLICGGNYNGNPDAFATCDYYMEGDSAWNRVYSSIKVGASGKYAEAELLSTKIINKLGTEGVVAVNTDGDLYDGTGEIREYRYSGIGNYCVYTDKDTNTDYNVVVTSQNCPTYALMNDSSKNVIPANKDLISGYNVQLDLKNNKTAVDSGLHNYVWYNNEMWRIVGVFDGKVKLVKDQPIEFATIKEDTYSSDEYDYKLTDDNILFDSMVKPTINDYFFYNYPSTYPFGNVKSYNNKTYAKFMANTYSLLINDWTNAGSMHYLNDLLEDSYFSTHFSTEAKEMMELNNYKLGNVVVDSQTATLSGTAQTIYAQERGTTVCDGTTENCNIFEGNQANWNGYVGLLYPSDYLYASSPENWTKEAGLYAVNGATLNNWMSNTTSSLMWFISPCNYSSGCISGLDYTGVAIGILQRDSTLATIRPTIYLKSTIKTMFGDGSYNNPFQLII